MISVSKKSAFTIGAKNLVLSSISSVMPVYAGTGDLGTLTAHKTSPWFPLGDAGSSEYKSTSDAGLGSPSYPRRDITSLSIVVTKYLRYFLQTIPVRRFFGQVFHVRFAIRMIFF